MSATPTLQLSKRCIELTPEGGDDNSLRSTNSLARGPSRSLNFDTFEEDAIEKDDIGNESDDKGINYEEDGLLQSVKGPSRSLNFDTLEEETIVKDDISNESGDEKSNYEGDNASDDDSLLQSVSDAFSCNNFAFTLFPDIFVFSCKQTSLLTIVCVFVSCRW